MSVKREWNKDLSKSKIQNIYSMQKQANITNIIKFWKIYWNIKTVIMHLFLAMHIFEHCKYTKFKFYMEGGGRTLLPNIQDIVNMVEKLKKLYDSNDVSSDKKFIFRWNNNKNNFFLISQFTYLLVFSSTLRLRFVLTLS